MGDPVGAMKHVREALDDDGTVMLVEPFAADTLAENLNPVGRIYYAASTLICTPSSLDQEVGLGLGAQAGEERLREVAEEAGFSASAGRRRRRSTWSSRRGSRPAAGRRGPRRGPRRPPPTLACARRPRRRSACVRPLRSRSPRQGVVAGELVVQPRVPWPVGSPSEAISTASRIRPPDTARSAAYQYRTGRGQRRLRRAADHEDGRVGLRERSPRA